MCIQAYRLCSVLDFAYFRLCICACNLHTTFGPRLYLFHVFILGKDSIGASESHLPLYHAQRFQSIKSSTGILPNLGRIPAG